MTDTRADEIKGLREQAFREFGSVALWSMRPKQAPTPADALAITGALPAVAGGAAQPGQLHPPVNVRELHRRVRSMIEDAEGFLAKLPSDVVGVVFLDGDQSVQPKP